jgi:hypothetical protein
MSFDLDSKEAKSKSGTPFTPGVFEVTLVKVVKGENTRTHVPNLVIECQIDVSSTDTVMTGGTRTQIYSTGNDYFKRNARDFFTTALQAQAKAKGKPIPEADEISLEEPISKKEGAAKLIDFLMGVDQPLRGIKLKVVAEQAKDPQYTNVRFSVL